MEQGQSELRSGEGTHLRIPQHVSREEDVSSPARNAGPSPDFLGETAPEQEHESADRPGPGRPGDVEFETFHRSFTIGAHPMDSVGGSRPAPEAEDSSPAPNPAALSPRPQEEQQQPPSSPAPPSRNKEDPTVLQARRSMMRRTGDRHARGKLPEPKEGRLLPPDCLPLEPQIPAPRSSKRYTRRKQRPPDFFECDAQRDDNNKPIQEDECIVCCRGCNLELVVTKAAVVVRCKNCNKVNPASVMDRFGRSQFIPR